jgi:hypothetical protein
MAGLFNLLYSVFLFNFLLERQWASEQSCFVHFCNVAALASVPRQIQSDFV